eukprot:m.33305 g.33305  ORF g.33305 m.33305 type:complete len:266 (+) comp31799_c0_seq5:129-926(+)
MTALRSIKIIRGSLGSAGLGIGVWIGLKNAGLVVSAEDSQIQTERVSSQAIKLYQYQTCPFCCKVRAFLDYQGIPYEKVEVNPLFKKELKFVTTKKIPLAVVQGTQIHESSLIISILKSWSLGSRSLEETMACYPEIRSKDKKGQEQVEYGNKYEVMLASTENSDARREEVKWRMWVDDKLIHALAPNIYRTFGDAVKSFQYISSVGNFGTVERYAAQVFGISWMMTSVSRYTNIAENGQRQWARIALSWEEINQIWLIWLFMAS